ncbi:hypothetical protein [Streptomyces shenzhenensis]|uniref:Uncharacterized protein n=1 Tax=Streptomyces shenzhenensis TaxID=943815 RepID=A0A3M0HYL1_9ACTN|nr:hypothetical protein [Streptomyces shenzhenensis]RMB81288.1 hypothetical protein CTZ28_35395 [Streptomyces shenzhenensis]
MLHRLLIVAELQEKEPDDGWAQYQTTGRACVVCPCGFNTGFIPKAEAASQYRAHADVAQALARQEGTVTEATRSTFRLHDDPLIRQAAVYGPEFVNQVLALRNTMQQVKETLAAEASTTGHSDHRLRAHAAEELRTAQTLVYARQADVAQARAILAQEEVALSEAMTNLNKVIDYLIKSS